MGRDNIDFKKIKGREKFQILKSSIRERQFKRVKQEKQKRNKNMEK